MLGEGDPKKWQKALGPPPASGEQEGGDGTKVSNATEATSDSSSSSASSRSFPDLDLQSDDAEMCDADAGEHSLIRVPEATRTRQDVFAFPLRHIRRIERHFGREALHTLSERMSSMTMVSLYSGLGGAEISAAMVCNALVKHGIEVRHPTFLLAGE